MNYKDYEQFCIVGRQRDTLEKSLENQIYSKQNMNVHRCRLKSE